MLYKKYIIYLYYFGLFLESILKIKFEMGVNFISVLLLISPPN